MPAPPKLTFPLHYAKWQTCTRCPLHEHRSKVVIARGELPCDILFIGEAPGESEDRLGVPFIGPAGKLLDQMIARAIQLSGRNPRLAFTNLVACIPKLPDEDGELRKIHEPPLECIDACRPRLNELVHLADPSSIVQVGRLAEQNIIGQSDFGGKYEYTDQNRDTIKWLHFSSIAHPASILRIDNVTQKQHTITTNTTRLADIFESYDVEIPF